jgi:hypothetical protein
VTRGAGAALPSGLSPQAAVPVLLFVAVNRFAGLRWAVVAATVWSIKVIVDRRRKGLPLGRFMPIVTAAVLIRGAIGAITGSEAIYFGLGIGTKYLVAAVLVGSALIGSPLAAKAAPYVMEIPKTMAQHHLFASTMAIVTLIGGVYYTLSASFDIWLFRRSSVEGFVLVRFLANWPLSSAAIIAIMATTQVRLQRIPGIPPVKTLVEQRLGAFWSDPDAHNSN